MMSKTLDEWLEESTHYSSLYYERYAAAWTDRGCSDQVRNYYCKVAKNYWDLKEVLQHIKNYGNFVNKQSCAACQHNDNHLTNLQSTYSKYKKWIECLQPTKKN